MPPSPGGFLFCISTYGLPFTINFFPEHLKQITMKLPFQSIYNAPLQFLIDKNMSYIDGLEILITQIAWLLVLSIISYLFWMKSLKTITVNGG